MTSSYHRQGPKSLCQNHDDLLSISEFTFDLKDTFFIGYFVSRTGFLLHLSKCAPGIRFIPKDKDGHPVGYTVTKGEWAEVCQRINRPEDVVDEILRAKIQDCWCLYSQHEERKNITADISCLAHKVGVALHESLEVAA